MNWNKAMQIATIGYIGEAKPDKVRFWVDPFYWSWEHPAWSFFKPLIEGVAVALFFFLRFKAGDIGDPVMAWGIALPLGFALRQSYYNLCCWAAGPEHGKSAFYAAAAAEATALTAWSIHQASKAHRVGSGGGVDTALGVTSAAVAVSAGAVAWTAWQEECQRSLSRAEQATLDRGGWLPPATDVPSSSWPR